MKGFVFVFVAMLLIPFGLTTAFADQSNVVEVQCPSDFFLTHVDCNEDGTFLLAGSTGTPMDSAPEMFGIDVNGHALWSIQGAHKAGSTGLYRSAAWLDNDTIIALCSEPNYPGYNTFVVQLIEQSEIIWQSEPMEGIMGVFPAPDGFLMTSNRDAASASIIRMNFDGELLWQIDWPEWLTFQGILTRGDTHVAFGSKTIREGDYDHDPTSVVIAFDDGGNILWRHDSLTSEEFTDGIWVDQDHLVLIGDALPDGTDFATDERWGYSFIAQYNEAGQLWRTPYHYTLNGRVSEGTTESIIKFENGYLVAVHPRGRDAQIYLLYYGHDGSLVQKWPEPMGDIGLIDEISLQKTHGGAHLIVSGKTGFQGVGSQDVPIAMLPYLTTVRGIQAPK
ncbi:MAG: hypothetical protein VB115_04980 [Christensenellaceae bacterium]|nr:hypothetical protein [Christensenellaceae bacterium]